MDRFNSFASQAKAKAEQGRVAAMSKADTFRNHSSTPTGDGAANPPNRSRTNSNVSASGGVFVGIEDGEKRAFFGLLDEYFASRPQYKELFGAGASLSTSTPTARTPATATPPPFRAAAAPIPQASPKPPPRARGLGTATALYDFEGGESEDLGFKEGDKILVLEHVSEDWWKGELRRKTGIFPSSYAKMD